MADLSYSDLTAQILEAMRVAGCAPHDPNVVALTGQLIRFRIEGDKAGSKNGWCIFYGDSLPAGAFGSWKTGLSETWCVKPEHELTEAERAQRKQQMDRAKRDRQALEKQVREHARQKAADLWAKAAEAVAAQHPYLLKKQIPAIGIRQLQQQLVIPLRDLNGVLHSLQFIAPEGRKVFITGGAKAGHTCLLGELAEEPDTLLLCEGYATGVSLHCASKLPVLICFDAGNLRPVAAALRLKYPHATLVFCADDDRWNPDAPGYQVGERKAREAADAVGGFVLLPLFDGLDTTAKPTDYNDLQCLAGLDQLKVQLSNALAVCRSPNKRREAFEVDIDATDDFEALTAILPRRIVESGLPKATVSYLLKRIAKKVKVPLADLHEQVKQATTPSGWKAKLRYDDNGNLKETLANLVHILNHDPAWRGVLVYDQFSGDVLKRRLPPYVTAELGAWADIDSSQARMWIEEQYDLSPATLLVDEAVQVVAYLHSMHVIKEYLDPLHWDHKPRLKTLALRYFGAEDTPVHRFVMQAWLVGAVKRIYEPGSKFDNVLVLEGKQGICKSTALAVLGGLWHAESITDVGSKDSLMILRGKWIIEFSEFDALGRVETSRIKQHISASNDVYRPTYGKRTITVQRQNVFAATVNPEKYLRDETGARRFWPIRCGAEINIEALRRDRDQLWAEAMHLYRQGEQTWATLDMTYITEAQDARFIEDPWEEPIMEFTYSKREVLVSSILLDCLRIDLGKQSQADKNRVAKILGRLGYTCKPTKRLGKVYKFYCKDSICN